MHRLAAAALSGGTAALSEAALIHLGKPYGSTPAERRRCASLATASSLSPWS